MQVEAPNTATPLTSDPGQATHACTRQVQQYCAGAMTAPELYAWVEKHRAMGADLTHPHILLELPATRRADYWRVMQGQGGSIPDAGILGSLEGIRSETRPGDFSASAPNRPGILTWLNNLFFGQTEVEPEIYPLRRQKSNLDLAQQITDGSDNVHINHALSLVAPEDRALIATAFSRMGGMHAPINRVDVFNAATENDTDHLNAAVIELTRQRAAIERQPDFPLPGPYSREKLRQESRVHHAYYEAQASPVGNCGEMAHAMMQELIECGVAESRLFYCSVTHPASQKNHLFIAYSPNGLKPLDSDNCWPIVAVDPWATRSFKLLSIHSKDELDVLATTQIQSAYPPGPIMKAAFNYEID